MISTTSLLAAITEVLNHPDMRESMAKRSVPVALSESPAEFNAFLQTESPRWARIIKDNNVRLE